MLHWVNSRLYLNSFRERQGKVRGYKFSGTKRQYRAFCVLTWMLPCWANPGASVSGRQLEASAITPRQTTLRFDLAQLTSRFGLKKTLRLDHEGIRMNEYSRKFNLLRVRYWIAGIVVSSYPSRTSLHSTAFNGRRDSFVRFAYNASGGTFSDTSGAFTSSMHGVRQEVQTLICQATFFRLVLECLRRTVSMCACSAASIFLFASSKLLPRTVTDQSSQTPCQPSSSSQKLQSLGTLADTFSFSARAVIGWSSIPGSERIVL
jgi:hypothetical protein